MTLNHTEYTTDYSSGREAGLFDAVEVQERPPDAITGHAATQDENEPEGWLPLPSGLIGPLAEPVGLWLDRYVAYAKAITPMLPNMFHEGAGLWLASTAIARRLHVRMPYGIIYPNLFIVWIARTTLYHKTTGLNVAHEIALEAFPHLLAAQDTTLESLLSDLAGREPAALDQMRETDRQLWQKQRGFSAQRGQLLDELSGLFATASKEYGRGLIECMLRLYDCDPRYTRSTRGQGHLVIRDTYLSLLGASTPAALAAHLGSDQLWHNGWWPRFALLTPGAGIPAWAEAVEPDRSERAWLVERVHSLYDALPPAVWPDPPTSRPIAVSEPADQLWHVYNKALSYDLPVNHPRLDARLEAVYGRTPTHALKVATILAALDWNPDEGDDALISHAHMTRAIRIAESWRASAHMVVTGSRQANELSLRDRIQRKLRMSEEPLTAHDVHRSMQKVPAESIKAALEELAWDGAVKRFEVSTRENGGRPTTAYRAIG